MILFEAVKTFLEYCAEQSPYINHTANSKGSANRFSLYLTDTVSGNNTNIGFPRLEVTALPNGSVLDFSSSQMDTMVVKVRAIDRLTDRYDVAQELTKQDNMKKALMQIVSYILTTQQQVPTNCLLCAFDPSSVRYQYINNSATDAMATGCEMTLTFKTNMDWEVADFGSLPSFPNIANGSIAVFLNGQWSSLAPGTAGQALTIVNGLPAWIDTTAGKPHVVFTTTSAVNEYTTTEVPDLGNIVVDDEFTQITLEGSIISPALYTWDGTTLIFSNDITINGNERVVIIQ